MSMMKLILYLFLFLNNLSIAQNKIDTITIKKKFGTIFYYHDKILQPAQLVDILKVHPEASKIMKKALRNFNWGIACGSIGGALIGFPLGTYLAGADLKVFSLVPGFVIIGLTIPFTRAYVKNAISAIKIYNESVLKNSTIPSTLNLK